MIKLNNTFAIGCLVQWYEIELVNEYIESLKESIDQVENKDNIFVDFVLTTNQDLEKIDGSITMPEIKNRFHEIMKDLTINYSNSSTDIQVHCDSYTWVDGVTYTASNNTSTYMFQTVDGCDSLSTLDLAINYSTSSMTNIIACDSVIWNGVTYASSGIYDTTFISPNPWVLYYEEGFESIIGNEWDYNNTISFNSTNILGALTNDSLQFDLVNLPLIEKVGKTGKPVILSTGMSNLGTVEEAIERFKKTGNKNLILLHCLSSYPANENEMNLKAIKTLKRNFNIPVGLSDHYPGIEISLMALGLGANIIERHFTINKSFEGPDHILSSEPKEMKKLVDIAKNTTSILGDGQKIIQPSEYVVINSQRKSIYAVKNIKVGEKLGRNNICIKGPGGGILPKYYEFLLKRKAKNKINQDHPVQWEDI